MIVKDNKIFYPLSSDFCLKIRIQALSWFFSLVIHLLLLMLLNSNFYDFYDKDRIFNNKHKIIQIDPTYYVEVNPSVEDNTPDNKSNYSFANQQSADKEKSSIEGLLPTIDGEYENYIKVKQGNLDSKVDEIETGLYSLSRNGEELIKLIPNSSQIYANAINNDTNNSITGINDKDIPIKGDGYDLKKRDTWSSDINIEDYESEKIFLYGYESHKVKPKAIDKEKIRPSPMKRVKLTDLITEGPLLKSNSSVSKYGDIAIDSTFSEFGEYERQFYTTLQIGWFDEIKFYKPIDAGANVSISFRLNSDGTIKDIKVLESNATFIATTICENAIQKRSPFRPWTKRMIDEFGHERELKIRFYYR